MYIIFSIVNCNEAFNALNLCERRAHLCQVHIDRLWNENHPLCLMLTKWEKFVHNNNLKSGVAVSSVRPVGLSARKSLSLISTDLVAWVDFYVI